MSGLTKPGVVPQSATRRSFAVVSLDNLMAALGGFEEAPPHPRDVWYQRLRKLRATKLTCTEIGERLKTSATNVRAHAHKLGLPRRASRWGPAT